MEILLSSVVAIGLHVGSYHDKPLYNNSNPGIYLVTKDNLVVGTYWNSFRQQSSYLAKNFTYELSEETSLGLSVGAVRGYRRASVLPLILPSIATKVTTGLNARLSFIPKVEKDGANVLHFSLEYLIN